MAEAHWDTVYDEHSDEELSWFQPDPGRSLEIVKQCSQGPSDAVADIGGGTSRLVDRLLESGYDDLTVVDISGSALARARQRLGKAASGVRWILGDVTKLHEIGPVQVWHDRAMFHFLTDPRARSAYGEVLRRSVNPSGYAAIATFAPDGPAFCSGLPVCRYDAASLAGELSESFELVAEEREDHTTPKGARQPFTWALFVRTV